MFSKRAQSEVITTILIILLVLAAIIIVWQVVKGTMDTTERDIANKKLCLGSQLSIVKAIAGNGTCPYPDKVAGTPCPIVAKMWTLRGPAGYCPQTPSNPACDNLASATLLPTVVLAPADPGYAPGLVIVTREPSTGNEDTIKARVFVDDAANNADSGDLAIYGKVPMSIVGLNVGQKVKVAALLKNGNLCSATDTVTTKSS